MNRANRIKTAHLEYAYLWTDSRVEYMQNFLTYGRQLTQVINLRTYQVVIVETLCRNFL